MEQNSTQCGYVPRTDGEAQREPGTTNFQACIGGQWVTAVQNSAQCGYVPPGCTKNFLRCEPGTTNLQQGDQGSNPADVRRAHYAGRS
jgi:hypothetical protein